MMTTFITGLQGETLGGPTSVLATAKHYVGDGGTTGGVDQGNTEISEAELRAIHLPPFQEAVNRNVGTIMISFSSWNAVKATQPPLPHHDRPQGRVGPSAPTGDTPPPRDDCGPGESPVRAPDRSPMMGGVRDTDRPDETSPRPAADTLTLAVAPAQVEVGGSFQVQVFVNGTEVTSAGAGLGMDPYDLLIPTNRLVATAEPHAVQIARCDCGDTGCTATTVTIVRDGDRVHWEWSGEVPLPRGVTFAADAYDAEVARIATDHSWETPERTAGRLVLTTVDHDYLGACGLRLRRAANHHRDPDVFVASLWLDEDYQIFVDIPWRGRTPEELAREVCRVLARPPHEWPASWHAITPRLTDPPPIAGRRWRRYQLRPGS